MYKRGESGFHHTGMFPDDYELARRAYEAAGFPCAQQSELPGGAVAAIMDARELNGHMVELYKSSESLRKLFTIVRELGTEHDRDEIVDGGSVAKLMSV
jgi:hypothetical protein